MAVVLDRLQTSTCAVAEQGWHGFSTLPVHTVFQPLSSKFTLISTPSRTDRTKGFADDVVIFEATVTVLGREAIVVAVTASFFIWVRGGGPTCATFP